MRTDWDALEFTKTRGWEARDRHEDELVEYEGLLRWCERRGLVASAQAEACRKEARTRPGPARAAAREARALRALAYRVLTALGTARRPSRDDLLQVTGWVRRYASARELADRSGGTRWEWRLDPGRLDQVLAPVAWSLAELLVAPEASRVRLCEGDDCGWLFVDGSRGGSRRWCTMSDCGNLAKVHRFREKQRRGQ